MGAGEEGVPDRVNGPERGLPLAGRCFASLSMTGHCISACESADLGRLGGPEAIC